MLSIAALPRRHLPLRSSPFFFLVLLLFLPAHHQPLHTASALTLPFDVRVGQGHVRLLRPDLGACPCTNRSLCEPITTPPRKEVYGFTVEDANGTNFKSYDWSVLTTVAFGGKSPELMCTAHEKGARVVLGAFGWDVEKISDEKYRRSWIQSHVQRALDGFFDGTNFDFESPLNASDPKVQYYTQLVSETTQAFHQAIPGSQVTVDVAWSPSGIDGRYYDYLGLSKAADLLFVMAYDTRSQIFGPCVAAANSPPALDKHGLEAFLAMGIPPSKLILGLPWYGYTYPCLTPPTSSNFCSIKPVPFRGVNCSDAAGREQSFATIMQMLNSSAAGARMWSDDMGSPFFNYKNGDGTVNQIWYDDTESLGIKYRLAKELQLQGVGFWNLDTLDYGSGSSDTLAMWEAVKEFI